MSFANKVVIAVGLSDKNRELFTPLKSMDFLKHSEVHFVHVFNTISYSFFAGPEVPLIYLLEEDREKIKGGTLSFLETISRASLPNGFDGEVILKCLFDVNPKHKFSEYVNEVKADLVIVPTREKRGFFESSFALFVNKNTRASMIFLK